MHKLHKELQTDIKFLSHHSVFYHNQHCAGAPMLKKRDKVYLLQKNIKMTRPSNKLDHVKIRPFKIIRNIKETSFELKLLKGMQWRHSVFHIFLLKSAPVEVPVLTQVSDNYLIKQEEWYEVEQILKHKDINWKWHYLVLSMSLTVLEICRYSILSELLEVIKVLETQAPVSIQISLSWHESSWVYSSDKISYEFDMLNIW